ncbi:energy-coupling factor ABC transporter ATP-binding protein [Raineyella sp. LH-20]|uniref:energy-coupling factor ABC transporter ATP-binding protein n=1 Tax=Raineyella sp. LH-20 TaxID=3081204 RepID=UPI00295322EA|nr:ATP-binding cassette domain-containing protein [Raineyella sp. LH-20]WOP19618.1 ATP-binding cassette domain-containing protein [Raineyella sp. LH-20]
MNSATAPIIDVRGAAFHYEDGTEALTEIDLSVRSGEFLALIGTNGSGKTTLSKCLNGILKVTRGSVTVDGRAIGRDTRTSDLIGSIGYVFQNPDHQLFNATIRDEIAYAPRNLGLDEAEVDRRVREAARTAGIGADLFDEHPFFQPKGIRQRIAIASILSLRPKIIIVDEPTTGQDYRQSMEVMTFLKELNEQHGHTIIVITHDMDIVAEFAHRVVAMTAGRVIIDGSTREVLSRADDIARADLMPPVITQVAQSLGDLGVRPDVLDEDEMVAEWERIAAGTGRAELPA